MTLVRGRVARRGSALCNHDRIENNILNPVMRETIGNCANNAWLVKHSNLNRINAQIRNNCIDLFSDKVRRYIKNGSDLFCVLGSECCHNRHAIAAQSRKCLEVSLYSGTSSRVRACDRKNSKVFFSFHRFCAHFQFGAESFPRPDRRAHAFPSLLERVD